MLREEAMEAVKEAYGNNEYTDEIIKALEQPCKDAVSRKAVKEGMIKYGFSAPDMTVTEFVENELPPIEGTPLLSNATNGDFIKANFDAEIVDDFTYSYGVKIDSDYFQFSKDWWDAPFKQRK